MSIRRIVVVHTSVLSILLLIVLSNKQVQCANGITSHHPPVEACTTNEYWCQGLDENEKLALEAIRILHRQLDDDQDGNINIEETDDFLREELKYERDYEKRSSVFHRNNDNQVSVRELWQTWVKSEVHNWTTEQSIEWLSVFVGLSQYEPIFSHKSINGTYLPRLAVNHLQFLSSSLGIKDLIHRQKLSLKAQDVVLFGPPKEYSNPIKDIILTSLLVIAMALCWYVYRRYKDSQSDLNKMMKDMESLSKAEQTLLELQKELDKSKSEIQNTKVAEEYTDSEFSSLKREVESIISTSRRALSSLVEGEVDILLPEPDDKMSPTCCEELEDQIFILRNELQRAEVELQDKCWVPPPSLQHWLQLTYELELKSYNKKRASAERQLKQAKDACDKLKRKRSSLMGAFVSTHGRSIDDVDKAILEARTALTEITHELQERIHRWKQIEMLVNCPVMNNPGLGQLEMLLRGYGKSVSFGGPGSVMSNSQDDLDDDGASSIYCPSTVHTLLSSSAFLMFPGNPGQHPPTSLSFASSQPNSRLRNYQLPIEKALKNSKNVMNTPTAINGTSKDKEVPNNNNRSVIYSYYTNNNNNEKREKGQEFNHNNNYMENLSSAENCKQVSMSGASAYRDRERDREHRSDLHQQIVRSKSTSSMISLKESQRTRFGPMGGGDSSKDSSNGEDEGLPSGAEASGVSPEGLRGGDRKVTFGVNYRGVIEGTSPKANGTLVNKAGQEGFNKDSNTEGSTGSGIEIKDKDPAENKPDLIKVPRESNTNGEVNGSSTSVAPSQGSDQDRDDDVSMASQTTIISNSIKKPDRLWKSISKVFKRNDSIRPKMVKSPEIQNLKEKAEEKTLQKDKGIKKSMSFLSSFKRSSLKASLKRSDSKNLSTNSTVKNGSSPTTDEENILSK